MKKGFTLIELLAVIIILAVIIAITVPTVNKIIKDSKKSTNEVSVRNYVRAIESTLLAIEEGEEIVEDGTYTINSSGNICKNSKCIEIDFDGSHPTKGIVTIKSGKVVSSIGIAYEKFYATIKNKNEIEIYYDDFEEVSDPVSFEEDSWEKIIANVQLGNASAYDDYVGQTKEVTLTGTLTGTFKVRLANTKTPDECNTPGFSQTACGFVIEFVDIITEHKMNTNDSNAGGWEDSEMRKYVNGDIYNSLPQEIKDGIIPTTVVSGHDWGKDTNYTTTDNLYLLSPKEVYGRSYDDAYRDASLDNTRQLDYYEKQGVTTESYSSAIKNFKGRAFYWWLRSADLFYSLNFITVSEFGNCFEGTGAENVANASNTNGVAPAFRIG